MQDKSLDFCYLMSSLASLLGGLGYASYAAANTFVDAFVYQHNKNHPIPWTSINCEGWQASNADAQQEFMRTTLADLLISPQEGVEIFKRILTMGDAPQLIISTGHLESRISQWVGMTDAGDEERKATKKSSVLHAAS